MRIRTIKPEFWSHRKTGRLPFPTKCLAIGLLNLCDDEGYFEADPVLIRASLFPFSDDSLSIHGALTELSNIGYIEVREDAVNDICVGRVIGFDEHQVVNRPSPSKLKDYYDSGRTHGGLTEPSLLEQGTGKGKEQGTGNGERPARKPARALSHPGFDEFYQAYPRKKEPQEARKAWNKHKPPLDQCLRAISSELEGEQWQEDSKFIPYPATWINKHGWESVPDEPPRRGGHSGEWREGDDHVYDPDDWVSKEAYEAHCRANGREPIYE